MTKSYSDRVKVQIDPTVHGEVPSDDWKSKLKAANWTDDPGTGKAILLEDGRELLNPVPMAPPIGYVPEDSIEKIINDRIRKHLQQLMPDDEIDSEEDAQDFDVPDPDFDPLSIYEIALMSDDFPGSEGAPGAKPPENSEVKKEETPSPSPSPPTPGDGK